MMAMMMAALASGLQAVSSPIVVVEPLRPTGKWSLNYDDGACTAARSFGAGNQLTVAIMPTPTSQTVELSFLTAAAGSTGSMSGQANVTLMPSGRAVPKFYSSGVVRGTRQRATRLAVARAELDELAGADSVTIATDELPTIALVPSGLKAVIAALRSCEEDLMRSWGYDVDAQAGIAVPATLIVKQQKPTRPQPVGKPTKPGALPGLPDGAAIAEGGRVTYGWKIGTDGKPFDCKILWVAQGAERSAARCNYIIDNERYTPALDRAGNKVPSVMVKTMTTITVTTRRRIY